MENSWNIFANFFFFQIVCSRVNPSDPEVVKAIHRLLDGRFYVPVMRSIDNSTPPIIGEPFMETQLPNVSKNLNEKRKKTLNLQFQN